MQCAESWPVLNCRKMELATIFLALFIALSAFTWRYLYRYKAYVYSLGLPVVRNIHWKAHQVNYRQLDQDRVQQFGNVWVDYSGTIPMIFVAEPDMIKDIMVKHFDSFTNRVEFGVEEQHMSLIDAR